MISVHSLPWSCERILKRYIALLSLFSTNCKSKVRTNVENSATIQRFISGSLLTRAMKAQPQSGKTLHGKIQ
jgi:hypothetical protein